MKIIYVATAAALALSGMTNLSAQSTETDGIDDAAPTAPKGATVTRENIEEQREVVDANGQPVLNDDGTTKTETVETGFTQTVETPSGNITTITKEDGSSAVVTHERPDRTERATQPERPDKADKPARPEKPERGEKPEKAAKPDRPGRP